MEPLVKVVCHEPEGTFERKIYPFLINPTNLKLFWDAAKKFPTLYGEEITSLEQFASLFISEVDGRFVLDGLFFAMPNEDMTKLLGMFYMTNITETEADVHYSFFDQRHKGRVPLVKELIKYVFTEYRLRRLNAIIPTYTSLHTRYFIKSIGFKLEGQKRSCARYKGKWFDVRFYGILADEFLTISVQTPTPETSSEAETPKEEDVNGNGIEG